MSTRSVLRRVFSRTAKAVLALLVTCGIAVGAIFIHIVTSFDGTATSDIADCAVVFGAAVRSGDQAGPGIVRRVETATRLYGEGKVHVIYLTGGKGGGNQLSEAEVMREFALRHGVPEKHLILEQESTSTWENVAHTKNLTKDCSQILAISDRYHLARIDLIARMQQWGNVGTFPADRHPPESFETPAVIRETLAYIYYGLKLQFLRFDEYDNY